MNNGKGPARSRLSSVHSKGNGRIVEVQAENDVHGTDPGRKGKKIKSSHRNKTKKQKKCKER